MAHEHDTADDLIAVLFEHAAAELYAHLHGCDRADIDRCPLNLFDDSVFNVVLVLDPTDAPHDVLGVVLLHDASACGAVALGDGSVQLAQADAVGAQFLGPHIDLVFQWRAADGRHVGHARGGSQLRRDVELVEGPQLARFDRVLRTRFDGVPVDLSQGRCVRREIGNHAVGEKRIGTSELLRDALPSKIIVDAVLEDDGDHREVELRRGTHGAHPRQAL